MFDFEEIRKLVELAESRDIAELEVTRLFGRLKIRRRSADGTSEVVARPVVREVAAPAPPVVETAPAPAPAEAPAASQEDGLAEIRSPMVGTFYSAPAPEAAPFAQAGQAVERGQVVCIIEAMKLMNEIESEVGGVIERVLVENAQPVQYDQPLFLVRSS